MDDYTYQIVKADDVTADFSVIEEFDAEGAMNKHLAEERYHQTVPVQMYNPPRRHRSSLPTLRILVLAGHQGQPHQPRRTDMPRVNHVKRAQQRYATKPVIDPATGEQKVVPVMNQRTGKQKVTKHGRPVVLRVTERDLERPLPMPRCDAPGCPEPSREIAVGSSYKWIEPSGQGVRNRHASCPTWQVWEYSHSLSARIAQIQHNGPTEFDSLDEAEAWAQDKAQEIRDLAEEKRESAENIIDGFGHETYQSEELNETADSLDEWADEIENADLPEYPEEGEEDCEACDATGSIEEECEACEGEEDECPECEGDGSVLDLCSVCGGDGRVDAEPDEEQVEEWRDEVLQDALDESPV